ncbi:MAG: hypothetical protein AAB772_01030 [Patescibacteria group bacterium]
MATITIQKEKIEKQSGVVILPLKEYRLLIAKVAPTYYLAGKKAKKLDKLVEEGLSEYKRGKTIKASSLKKAIKVYAKQNRD